MVIIGLVRIHAAGTVVRRCWHWHWCGRRRQVQVGRIVGGQFVGGTGASIIGTFVRLSIFGPPGIPHLGFPILCGDMMHPRRDGHCHQTAPHNDSENSPGQPGSGSRSGGGGGFVTVVVGRRRSRRCGRGGGWSRRFDQHMLLFCFVLERLVSVVLAFTLQGSSLSSSSSLSLFSWLVEERSNIRIGQITQWLSFFTQTDLPTQQSKIDETHTHPKKHIGARPTKRATPSSYLYSIWTRVRSTFQRSAQRISSVSITTFLRPYTTPYPVRYRSIVVRVVVRRVRIVFGKSRPHKTLLRDSCRSRFFGFSVFRPGWILISYSSSIIRDWRCGPFLISS